jgi:hypothetical protein
MLYSCHSLGAVYYLFTAYTEKAFLHPFRLFKHPLMPHKHSEKVRYHSEDQIQTLSLEEIQTKLQAEIEQHQLQVMILQQQLIAIKRGDING